MYRRNRRNASAVINKGLVTIFSSSARTNCADGPDVWLYTFADAWSCIRDFSKAALPGRCIDFSVRAFRRKLRRFGETLDYRPLKIHDVTVNNREHEPRESSARDPRRDKTPGILV